jgi:SAM-dependent methyltransferase
MTLRQDSTRRFSDRVENYIKYRPTYPDAVMTFLKTEIHLTPACVVADIGSGTGISSEMFLKNGNPVFGIEPNTEMRQAAERLLAGYAAFTSISGTAEDTTLDAQSIDLAVAGQAFHWFDRPKAKIEFTRILKPNGHAVLIWNDRKVEATPFLKAYDALLYACGVDYEKVNHKNIDETTLKAFFGRAGFVMKAFHNEQVFDYAGFEGRVLSSSYVPNAGEPKYDEMIDGLKKIFNEHQSGGHVVFEYDTTVFVGRMD